MLSAFLPTALDTSAADRPGSPSAFQAMFSGAVRTRAPVQSGGPLQLSPTFSMGGWSMAWTPNVVALVRLTVTQSPSWPRITSGWIGSSFSPVVTCPDASSARTAEMLELSTYMNEFGSCTPYLFKVMSTLMAEMLNVSCGAVAHGFAVAVAAAAVPALGLALAMPLVAADKPRSAMTDPT